MEGQQGGQGGQGGQLGPGGQGPEPSGPGPNCASEDDMKHPCWGVCLEGECKQKCAHQMGAPHMWCKENCGECMKCVKKSHQEQMEKEGQQGPMAGGQGTQGPMTGGQGSQGPMGGQGTQGPMTGGQGPMGGQAQGPQAVEVGSNT